MTHKAQSQGGFEVKTQQSRLISKQALLCLAYIFQTPRRARIDLSHSYHIPVFSLILFAHVLQQL